MRSSRTALALLLLATLGVWWQRDAERWSGAEQRSTFGAKADTRADSAVATRAEMAEAQAGSAVTTHAETAEAARAPTGGGAGDAARAPLGTTSPAGTDVRAPDARTALESPPREAPRLLLVAPEQAVLGSELTVAFKLTGAAGARSATLDVEFDPDALEPSASRGAVMLAGNGETLVGELRLRAGAKEPQEAVLQVQAVQLLDAAGRPVPVPLPAPLRVRLTP